MIEISDKWKTKQVAVYLENLIRGYCDLKRDADNDISHMHMVSETLDLLNKYSNVTKRKKKVSDVFSKFNDLECYRNLEKAESFYESLNEALYPKRNEKV